MKDFGNIIYKIDTKAYVIYNNTFTVPHPDDTSVPGEIHKELDDLYKEIEIYAKANPGKVTNKQPYILDLDDIKNSKLSYLNNSFEDYRNSSTKAYLTSSLGYKINANETAVINLLSIIFKLAGRPKGSTEKFCIYDNTFRDITLNDAITLFYEVSQNGTGVYGQKWLYRQAINDATDKADVDAINVNFQPSDDIGLKDFDPSKIFSGNTSSESVGTLTLSNNTATLAGVHTLKIPNSEITNEGQGVVQVKPYVTLRNEGTGAGASIAEEIALQYPLRTSASPDTEGLSNLYIDPMFFNKNGISCYRYLDEDESIRPNKEGNVWFTTKAVQEGGFLQVDEDKKLLGIQETDGKDPNTTDGSDFLVIYRIVLNGIAPEDGTVRIWIQEHDALGNPINIAEDENGNICGVSHTYSKGDKLGVLQIVRFIKAKALKYLSFMVHNPFSNDLSLGNRTNGNSCVVIQEVTNDFRTGKALQQFELDTQQNIPFTRHYLGERHITLEEVLIDNVPTVDVPANTYSALDDGWGMFARLPVTTSIQDNVFNAEQTGQELADFVFFKLMDAQQTSLVRGKSEKITTKIQAEQCGFRLLLMKWTKNIPVSTIKMLSRTNMTPVFEEGWEIVDEVDINENTSIQTIEHTFDIPTDAVQYAYAFIPNEEQSPMNLVLESFVGDIINPFYSHIIEKPVINEQAMRFVDDLYEFTLDVSGFASLRYTVANDYRPCPIGYQKKGGTALTLDKTVQVIIGSSAYGGEGALVCGYDGIMQWTTKFLVWNEKNQDNVFNARLVKILPDGSKQTIKDAFLSAKIPMNTKGTIVELKTGKFKVSKGDKLGLDFSSNEIDGCYLMSINNAEQMINTTIRYEEIL